MRDSNLKLGNLLASKYHKEYGVITYSGTLAIELALISANLPAGSKVLVSNTVCSSIVQTIIKLNLKPVVVCPQDGLILRASDIEKVVQKIDISCIIVVHQYGLVNPVLEIRQLCQDKIIIEDIAQAYDIEINSKVTGQYSDYLVTSFGITKPLSYGIGGSVISNNKQLLNYVDFADSESRNTKEILSAYAYPLCEQIDFTKLLTEGKAVVEHQRLIAKTINQILPINNISYFIDNIGDNSVWHRFPIWIDDLKILKVVTKILDDNEVGYQFPHEVELQDLPLFKEKIIVVDNRIKKDYFILIRTRTNTVDKVKKAFLEIRDVLTKSI